MYKSVRVDLRLSPREAELLDEVRGNLTRSAWIRQQITNAAKTRMGPEFLDTVRPPLQAVPTGYQSAAEDTEVLDQPVPVVINPPVEGKLEPNHLHRRGQRLDPPRWVKGQAIWRYQCKEPGCGHIME